MTISSFNGWKVRVNASRMSGYVGLCDYARREIRLCPSLLSNPVKMLITLAHELYHAISGSRNEKQASKAEKAILAILNIEKG